MSPILRKPDCLPEPFEWIFIPGGKVQLQYVLYNPVPSFNVEVSDFYIAKYPVTNAQFEIYIRETRQKISRRQNLEPSKFNQPLQPVIDVSWYEAMHFCQWLSEKEDRLITLPTNAQWQRAAQGDDNRLYPWGDDWDGRKCNTASGKIGHTTPVNQYPQGASPYGVMDMVGNVFEWCLTDPKTGANSLHFTTSEDFPGEERMFYGGDYGSNAPPRANTPGSCHINHFYYPCGIRLVAQFT
jgi:formylglycine-generating enzyme required for sulfatase activity